MKIIDIVCAKGKSGFFFDDQLAIKKNAVRDGFTYEGKPITAGFKTIRQAGESVLLMILLDDGQIAYGDCTAVQYSGTGGREKLFLANDFIPIIYRDVRPKIIGKKLTSFKLLAEEIDQICNKKGELLHPALRYGLTQALLDAVAKSRKKLMCEVIAEDYGLQISKREIPIFTQSGDDCYDNVDKMIIKEAKVLPHALINNVQKKLGSDGSLLIEYLTWLRNRVLRLRTEDSYEPVLHIHVYGTIGEAFKMDEQEIVEYLMKLEKKVFPLHLRMEGIVDAGSRASQIEFLGKIKKMLEIKESTMQIVADEWCNTYEDIKAFADAKASHILQIKTPDLGGINNAIQAVLYCNKKGMGAYLGGSCNETERSAKVSVHIAMATKPLQMLAKPGMGVDEGYMIVYNEMQRILALRKFLEKC